MTTRAAKTNRSNMRKKRKTRTTRTSRTISKRKGELLQEGTLDFFKNIGNIWVAVPFPEELDSSLS